MTIDPRWAFSRLGTEQAGNLPMWRDAVALETLRLREALAHESAPVSHDEDVNEDSSWRLDIEAHFLMVAIRNGVRLVEQLLGYVPDARLKTALDDLPRRFPHAKDLRDVLTHLDEYVLDNGRLQKPKHGTVVQPGSTSWRAEFEGEVVLVFGPLYVPLLAVGEAAHELLVMAAEVWHQGLVDNVDGLDPEPADPVGPTDTSRRPPAGRTPRLSGTVHSIVPHGP